MNANNGADVKTVLVPMLVALGAGLGFGFIIKYSQYGAFTVGLVTILFVISIAVVEL